MIIRVVVSLSLIDFQSRINLHIRHTDRQDSYAIIILYRIYHIFGSFPPSNIESFVPIGDEQFLDRNRTHTKLNIWVGNQGIDVPRQRHRVGGNEYEDIGVNKIPHRLPVKKRRIIDLDGSPELQHCLPSLVVLRLFRFSLRLFRDVLLLFHLIYCPPNFI